MDAPYTGAPNECSACYPHRLHVGSCEGNCPECRWDALKIPERNDKGKLIWLRDNGVRA